MNKYLGAALLVASVAATTPVQAQSVVDGRVDRLEREMRAVQRKVFPGGTGATVSPDITAPQRADVAPGAPSGGALTDLNARVDALESSVRSVTGQVEQANFKARQIEDAFNAYRRSTEARLKALEDGAASTGAPSPGEAVPPVGDTGPSARPAADRRSADRAEATATATPRTPTLRPAVARTAASTPTRAAADPTRAAAIKEVERPSSGDAAEDGYNYGFRLWSAKLYPEAAAELKTVADKYPKHRRASYAQNLLGRTYLDDNKPSLASLAFYDSYKKYPDGERAPDSLFYLARALTVLKKPAADVCKVYGELTDVYGGKLSASMKADVEKGRASAKCK